MSLREVMLEEEKSKTGYLLCLCIFCENRKKKKNEFENTIIYIRCLMDRNQKRQRKLKKKKVSNFVVKHTV